MEVSFHISARYWGLPFAVHFETERWSERVLSFSFLCFGVVLEWPAKEAPQ